MDGGKAVGKSSFFDTLEWQEFNEPIIQEESEEEDTAGHGARPPQQSGLRPNDSFEAEFEALSSQRASTGRASPMAEASAKERVMGEKGEYDGIRVGSEQPGGEYDGIRVGSEGGAASDRSNLFDCDFGGQQDEGWGVEQPSNNTPATVDLLGMGGAGMDSAAAATSGTSAAAGQLPRQMDLLDMGGPELTNFDLLSGMAPSKTQSASIGGVQQPPPKVDTFGGDGGVSSGTFDPFAGLGSKPEPQTQPKTQPPKTQPKNNFEPFQSGNQASSTAPTAQSGRNTDFAFDPFQSTAAAGSTPSNSSASTKQDDFAAFMGGQPGQNSSKQNDLLGNWDAQNLPKTGSSNSLNTGANMGGPSTNNILSPGAMPRNNSSQELGSQKPTNPAGAAPKVKADPFADFG